MADGATDRELLDRLVREHLPALLRLATRLTGDPHTAEEVVQEALARIARGWTTFRRAAAFRTWATRIVINAFRDQMRRTRRELVRETPSGVVDDAENAGQAIDPRGDEPSRAMLDAELAEVVARHVSSLPERQREVLILIVYENLQAAEVAELLETTVANVHSTMYAARQAMARRLADYLAPAEMAPRIVKTD